ncbi:hypothetical protein [Pararhodospirillum photometricum]|nr:hypothetical protein [Pararhodospirillum photometricum]
MAQSIPVGTSANLLFGYQPVWNPSGEIPVPFFGPATPPLRPQNMTNTPVDFPLWGGTPVITLHQSPQSLVSTIYDYDVLPTTSDPKSIVVPSGPLSLNDADSKSALAATQDFLGLNLSGPGNYMLVVYERRSSTITGDFWDGNTSRAREDILTEEALAIVEALPRAQQPTQGSVLYDSKLTLADAKKYLAAINALGTHFVTKVFTGDKLLQVFSYDDKAFKYLQSQFKLAATPQPDGTLAVSGILANSWAMFTAPASTGGFVKAYGALTTFSRDPALLAAIAEGKWANGYVPDGTPSIFAASQDYGLFAALSLDVPYACELTPMAELMPGALVEGPWNRVVAGGLTQKYGNEVIIPLRHPLDYDWAKIFPETTESWASGIVTPVIDIYQERVDLAEVKMMGADIIGETYTLDSFSCFSQVLQATTGKDTPPIPLPSDSITIIAQIIDTTQAAQTPVLLLSEKGLRAMTVACQEMYGTLIFQREGPSSPVTRKTALDGFLMATPEAVDPLTHRYLVEMAGVLTDPPSEAVLIAHSQSVEFSVVAGEALLQSQGTGADVVKGLELTYLNWLASIIPANTQDVVLANARVQALYLANAIADFGMNTVFVPYVTYDSYAKYVGDLVTQAMALSGQIANYQSLLITTEANYKVMTSIQAVNDNVRSIGGVLTQYFKALADGRNSIDQYYGNINAQLSRQLDSTLKNIGDLQVQLGEQQKRISNLGAPPGIVQQFETDYVAYQKDQVFKLTMSIVTGLFSLGAALAGFPGAAEKGVADALKAMVDVFQKLQSVMQVINQLGAIEKVTNDIGKINQLAQSIQSAAAAGTMAMPSLVDLQMVPINVEAALVNVPDSGSLQQDKANLIAATKNLVIVGSALLTAQSEASRLLVEIANNERLRTINSQQQAKMSALGNALNLSNPALPPDLAKIDLIGTTGQLQFQLKQVLSTLAKVLANQNGALQFTYFGTPVAISSFSLNQLLAVIANQDANILSALQHLNPQPQKIDQPITVKIGPIPYKELINGSFKRITIHQSDPGFWNYVMVRIDRVVPRVRGVASTASGSFEISLDTQAHPFLDRDPERQPYTFVSTRRVFGPYVYDVATGAAQFGTNTGTFADKVTQLTPFTDWNVSLPAKSTNKDITFNELLVDIEIDFYVTAIYNDPVALMRQRMIRAMTERRAVPMARLAAPSPDAEALAFAALPDSSPSLAYLEAQMYQNQSVLNGWDAVFSMLSGPVNAFLNQQFLTYIQKLVPGDNSGLMPISASFFGTATPVGRGFWSSTVTQLDFRLTTPLLQFIASSDQASVQQYIKSGSVAIGSVDVTGNNQTKTSAFLPSKTTLPAGPLTFRADTTTKELVIAQGNVLGLALGSIYLSTTGTLPAPLQVGDPSTYTNEYYIARWTTTDSETRITLTSDPSGEKPIEITSAGSGTHTLTVDVSWGSPSVMDISQSPYVFANVQLSTIVGLVDPPAGQGDKDNTLSVVLDFPTGSFVLRNIHVEPPNWSPSAYATQISAAIANYYAQNDIRFLVQTLNTTDLAADKALTPSKFVLHAMTTNAGNNVLQLLIATTGTLQNTHTINVSEPVAYNPAAPVAGVSDFMISLMISSKLTFQHIFVDSFNRGSTNFVLAAVQPDKDFEAWSARMTSGTMVAVVPFEDSYDVNGTKTQFRMSASGNTLKWDVTGLTFSRTETDGVALYYSNGTANPPTGGTNVDFQYRQYVYVSGGSYAPGHWYWTNWTDASAMTYVTMTGTYPLEVRNSGPNQLVEFATTNPTITVDKSSDLKPTGACECNNNDLKIALMSALSASLPAELQKNMQQISFKPISIMALESLLFPAEQLIAMSTAKVPADSLVVGRFLAQVRKTCPTYTVTIPASAGAQGSFGGVSFKSGDKVSSVTKGSMPATFEFIYGPIDPALGGQVTYRLNIQTGEISPKMIAVIYQPDISSTTAAQNVTLLLPGYPLPTTS